MIRLQAPPPPRVSKLDREGGGEGGKRGAESYDRNKVLSFINHSILSGLTESKNLQKDPYLAINQMRICTTASGGENTYVLVPMAVHKEILGLAINIYISVDMRETLIPSFSHRIWPILEGWLQTEEWCNNASTTL